MIGLQCDRIYQAVIGLQCSRIYQAVILVQCNRIYQAVILALRNRNYQAVIHMNLRKQWMEVRDAQSSVMPLLRREWLMAMETRTPPTLTFWK